MTASVANPTTITALPVADGAPPPTFSPLSVGDIDTRWLDMSAWSASRGGDLPNIITATVLPAGGLVVVSAIQSDSVPVVGGTTLAVSIAIVLDATAATAVAYTLVLDFTTTFGETINRPVHVPILATY